MRARRVGCWMVTVMAGCGSVSFLATLATIAALMLLPQLEPRRTPPPPMAPVGSVPDLDSTVPDAALGLVTVEGTPLRSIPSESVYGTIAIWEPTVRLLRRFGETAALARGYAFLAMLHGAVGEFTEADRAFEEARRILEKQPNAGPTLTWLYCIRGNTQMKRGQFANAVQTFLTASAIPLPNDRADMEWRVVALQNLATTYLLLGDADNAESAFLKAIDILRRQHDLGGFADQAVRSNLAIFYASIGDLATARTMLKTLAAESGLDRQERFGILNHLGYVLAAEGAFGEAERWYLKAEALAPRGSPWRATVLANETLMYSKAGQLDRATAVGREALRLINSLYGESSSNSASLLTVLGDVALKKGRLVEAERMLVRAFPIFEKHHDDEARAVAARTLALVAQRLGQNERANILSRRALDFAEARLHQILAFGSEAQRLAYQSQAAPYDQLASLAEPNLLAEAVLTMKGAVLESLLSERAATRNSSPAEQMQLDRINVLKLQIMEQIGRGSDHPEAFEEALKRAQSALARKLASRLPETRTDVQSVQKKIAPDEVLVEIIRFQQYGSGGDLIDAYGAVVIPHQGSPVWVPLGSARAVDDAIRGIAGWFGGGRGMAPQRPRQHVGALLRDLYGRVWKPLAKTFPRQTRRVILSPDEVTSFLPWTSLIDETGTTVAERWQITEIGSGRDLLKTTSSTSAKTLLALGDGEDNLEYSRREVNQLDEIARRHGWRTTIRLGEKASEHELYQHPRPRILHLATHAGWLQPGLAQTIQTRLSRNPMYRGFIVLGGGANTLDAWTLGSRWTAPFADDGILTAEEASTLDLRDNWLTVLSACETGFGEARAGEGVMGLRRGFALAGTQNLVFSLWAVDDASTAEFMSVFYARLFRVNDPARAFHEAQVTELRRWRRRASLEEAVYRAGGFVLTR